MCVSIANDIVIVILKVPGLDVAVIDAYKSRYQNNVLAFNYEVYWFGIFLRLLVS